ncbi:MAG: NAD-dependent epimerase/dehydratase family protein [Anaerolineales bacterium]|nr:NAD-dependent epimerase/dehydratase family protein [Anaerolineales bacterium]MBS3752061.1 NAD-dependent epimerase/dehydratase family protein [Anaerolineales bacterium]
MQKETVLITGVCGEIGQALLESLAKQGKKTIITLDLKPLPPKLSRKATHIRGDLTDPATINQLSQNYEFDVIFHLAALLSTTGEYKPFLAHEVNVGGTFNLINRAAEQSQQRGKATKFLFPSSIAAYGLPDLSTKKEYFHIKEREWNEPITMYGCTKLYCEKIGRYFSKHYLQLDTAETVRLDFRALRFPGLISAFTVPSGGTSDYGPEMIHAAAQGEPYACFVRPDVRIPFMVMPDAVKALLMLAAAPQEGLHRNVYNVTSFNLSAGEFKDMVQNAFPGTEITFEPDEKRQRIVDSWPADLDDSAARLEWDWKPDYDANQACKEYLLPNIRKRYN